MTSPATAPGASPPSSEMPAVTSASSNATLGCGRDRARGAARTPPPVEPRRQASTARRRVATRGPSVAVRRDRRRARAQQVSGEAWHRSSWTTRKSGGGLGEEVRRRLPFDPILLRDSPSGMRTEEVTPACQQPERLRVGVRPRLWRDRNRGSCLRTRAPNPFLGALQSAGSQQGTVFARSSRLAAIFDATFTSSRSDGSGLRSTPSR